MRRVYGTPVRRIDARVTLATDVGQTPDRLPVRLFDLYRSGVETALLAERREVSRRLSPVIAERGPTHRRQLSVFASGRRRGRGAHVRISYLLWSRSTKPELPIRTKPYIWVAPESGLVRLGREKLQACPN